MAIPCKVCERTQLSKPGICASCCEALGVIAMPPSTRSARPCQRCNGMKFVRAIPRELTDQAAPMTLTYDVTRAAASNVKGGYGRLEAWACLACNFVEWYCQDTDRIPIGPEYMTELVDYESDAPYR